MDGFAVRSADTPGTLAVAGSVAAGRPSEAPVAAGQAIAISTGGVVPAGADAVVPIEDVVEADGVVTVAGVVDRGANVRPRGGDLAAGDAVVARGTRLGPAQLGALAASGLTSVRCARRPRAAVVVTGSEV